MFDGKLFDEEIFDTSSNPSPDESQPRDPKSGKPVYEIQGMPNKIVISISISLIIIGLTLQAVAVPLSEIE